MTARAEEVATVPPPARPLTPVRALRRIARDGGIGSRVLQVRALLEQLTAPEDLETAGRVLAAPAVAAELRGDGGLPSTGLVIYAGSTVDVLGPAVTACGVRDGVVVETRTADFNVWRTDLLAGAPGRKDAAGSPVLLALDDTAVFDAVRDPVDVTQVQQRCAALVQDVQWWIDRAKEIFGSLVVVTTIPLSPLRRDSIIDYRNKARLDAAWAGMNARLLELSRDGVVVLASEAVAARGGPVFAADRMRHIAGTTFAPDYLSGLAAEVVRVLLAHLGRAAKCLVLDLDGTLWDGVVGDDGTAGLGVGGAYPGSAHLELQRLGRDLAAQGVLLAVVSKNHEDIALAAMAEHPEMVLRPDSLVAHRIDFEPKPDHLAALAGELNIDVSALVFVDDNPVERGLVRALQPDVHVVELPRDPAQFARHVAARGAFNLLARTAEDAARTDMYRAERRRTTLQRSAATREEYLQSLGSELHLLRAAPMNVVRTAQLFGKTNQFNLTGRRYTADEVSAGAAGGQRFVVGRLTDTFGDSGIVVALAVSEPDESTWSIDNMVLSCRAFARGVEQAVLAGVLRAAAARGCGRLTGHYVPSPKNRAFADFFAAHGFEPITADGGAPDGATRWQRTTDPLPAPAWLTVSEPPEVFDVAD